MTEPMDFLGREIQVGNAIVFLLGGNLTRGLVTGIGRRGHLFVEYESRTWTLEESGWVAVPVTLGGKVRAEEIATRVVVV